MGQGSQKRYSYQYGSEAKNYYAPATNPDWQEPRRKSAPSTHKKLDIKLISQLSLCGTVVFVCAFLYVHMYSSLITAQSELKSLKNEIRETKSSISYTKSKISEKLNLEYIKERASKELGMGEPLPYQIVYIDLPKQSYTIYDR